MSELGRANYKRKVAAEKLEAHLSTCETCKDVMRKQAMALWNLCGVAQGMFMHKQSTLHEVKRLQGERRLFGTDE
jgi:hypothetical protein